MLRRYFLSALVAAGLGALCGPATLLAAEPAPAATPVTPQDPALRLQLLSRFQRDQEVRKRLVEFEKTLDQDLDKPDPKRPTAPQLVKEVRSVDDENREWLKPLIEKHGWLGRTLVGVDGAHAAWLLVQHADRDLPFQQLCLKLMIEAPEGEVEPWDIAYLTDRVRLAEGRGQVFGTQVVFSDGRWQARNVFDANNLDERRKSIGLPPIQEYLKSMEETYGIPKPTTPASGEKK